MKSYADAAKGKSRGESSRLVPFPLKGPPPEGRESRERHQVTEEIQNPTFSRAGSDQHCEFSTQASTSQEEKHTFSHHDAFHQNRDNSAKAPFSQWQTPPYETNGEMDQTPDNSVNTVRFNGEPHHFVRYSNRFQAPEQKTSVTKPETAPEKSGRVTFPQCQVRFHRKFAGNERGLMWCICAHFTGEPPRDCPEPVPYFLTFSDLGDDAQPNLQNVCKGTMGSPEGSRDVTIKVNEGMSTVAGTLYVLDQGQQTPSLPLGSSMLTFYAPERHPRVVVLHSDPSNRRLHGLGRGMGRVVSEVLK